ncbi:unnamed protein product [Phytomonas sp. Hart1]|nr:unnamed protein product [Phytomonas sp. Hart1]|eukprot:CCW67490.1 unnamed protein product [Phytomonas sp. isolate Hart1]
MIAFLFLAAVIWGVTNPFLKQCSAGMKLGGSLKDDLNYLIRCPRYLCIQLINISGSLFFFMLFEKLKFRSDPLSLIH